MLYEDKDEVLEKMSKKLDDDLIYEESSEPEYLLRLSNKIARWQSLYSKKLREFKHMEIKLDEKYKELYMYYQFEFDVKLDKKELSIFIKSDGEYTSINSKFKNLEVQLGFIEKAIKTLEGQSWNIKTRLEYLKALGFVQG